MADSPLTRRQRLALVAELCPEFGGRRACDSFAEAQRRAVEILGPADRAEVSADYVLMRAIDRYVAGRLSLEDLYRCRVLAYYMTFAAGGEEWARWGVGAAVRTGRALPEEAVDAEPDDDAPDDDAPPPPAGPPWQRRPS